MSLRNYLPRREVSLLGVIFILGILVGYLMGDPAIWCVTPNINNTNPFIDVDPADEEYRCFRSRGERAEWMYDVKIKYDGIDNPILNSSNIALDSNLSHKLYK